MTRSWWTIITTAAAALIISVYQVVDIVIVDIRIAAFVITADAFAVAHGDWKKSCTL
jgi:hypothetical protein